MVIDMRNYHYIKFADGVPAEIEKEYNRLYRQEQYQYESAYAHGVIYLKQDSLLQNIADPDSLALFEQKSEIDYMHSKRIELLNKALEQLKNKFPKEYALIYDYYFSIEKMTVVCLGKKYGITHQAVCKKLKKARERLKEYIILHETKDV